MRVCAPILMAVGLVILALAGCTDPLLPVGWFGGYPLKIFSPIGSITTGGIYITRQPGVLQSAYDLRAMCVQDTRSLSPAAVLQPLGEFSSTINPIFDWGIMSDRIRIDLPQITRYIESVQVDFLEIARESLEETEAARIRNRLSAECKSLIQRRTAKGNAVLLVTEMVRVKQAQFWVKYRPGMLTTAEMENVSVNGIRAHVVNSATSQHTGHNLIVELSYIILDGR